MKKTIVKMGLIAILLSGMESLSAPSAVLSVVGRPRVDGGGGDPPLCFPGTPNCPRNQAGLRKDGGGGLPPLCFPGTPNCPRD